MTDRIGLLSELSPVEQQAVLARMHRRAYDTGEIICHEGDPADTVHFVVEGRVVARRVSEGGDIHAYAVMGVGQAFGEIAMVRREHRRTATIETLEPTVTLSLRYADFEQLCVTYPEVNRLLLRLLAARVTRLTDALMHALHEPAEQRVLRVLVVLAGLYSSPGTQNTPVTVTLNQTVLAELAGVTRPTANRVLRRLVTEGALELDRARVRILDPNALRDAADLTPS
jgi:CRP-like cAMP-binding protein